MPIIKFLLLATAILASAILCDALQPNTFKRVFIVLFENQNIFSTLNCKNFEYYAEQGTLLSQYYAVTHPSQPNYLAITAGSTFGKYFDDTVNVSASNVADLLEAKGLDWRSYQEDYPADGNCHPNEKIGKYYRKHNPFMSYDNIRTKPDRCSKIVPASQLDMDIKTRSLPEYMFYTPNIDNDCHNTGLSYCDKYLPTLLDPLLKNPYFMDGTLIVLTFDEDDGLIFANNIYTVLLGNMVQKGMVDRNHYTHYSLLKTIEENFQLGDLGRNDTNATAINSLNDPSQLSTNGVRRT